MNPSTVITIGRQYGSGGHEIGAKLAEKLGIPFYDKELLAAAAERSGMTREMFESYDEQPTNSFLYSLSMGAFTAGTSINGLADMPLNNQVFIAMVETIRSIAKQGGCIIVGRCADYALLNYKPLCRVFIHADLDKRVARIMERQNVSEKEAAAIINKTDKKRANYHNFYSDSKWGITQYYDLTVNSGTLGIENSVELIAAAAELIR